MTDRPLHQPVLGRAVTGSIPPHDIDLMPCLPGVTSVTIRSTEVQAVCPVTGQPDIYAMDLTYYPHGQVIESKALKMYLTGWRNVGISCEDLAAVIARHLGTRLSDGGHPDPTVFVTLTQQVRGGLVIEATGEWPVPQPGDGIIQTTQEPS